MSGSRQQLDKISVSDIQLMSTVPFFNHLEDSGPGGANTRSPNVVLVRLSPWCRKLGSDAGRYRSCSP